MRNMFQVPRTRLSRILVAAVAIAVLLLCWYACEQRKQLRYVSPFTREKLDQEYETYGCVAHALGFVNGMHYTNSLEAFQASYDAGFRIFEADLVLLADGIVLAAHDGMEKYYGQKKKFWELKADEIPKKYNNELTVLFDRDLLRLVDAHPDAYFILDAKARSLEEWLSIFQRLADVAREHCPESLDRLIPHVSDQWELDGLREIYPFKDYMACLYRSRMSDRDAVNFVMMNGIKAVMMWWDKRYSTPLDNAMRKAGAVTFVHSLTPDRPAELAAMRRFRSLGVGVYVNGLYRAEH